MTRTETAHDPKVAVAPRVPEEWTLPLEPRRAVLSEMQVRRSSGEHPREVVIVLAPRLGIEVGAVLAPNCRPTGPVAEGGQCIPRTFLVLSTAIGTMVLIVLGLIGERRIVVRGGGGGR